MKYFLNQQNKTSCGESCIRMILASLHNDENYLFITLPNSATNFKEIKECARAYNVDADGYIVEDKKAFRKVKTPLILQFKVGDKEHFVVAKKMGPRSYQILDPAKEEYYLSEKELWKYFTGRYLVFNLEKKTKAPLKITFKPSKKRYIFSGLLNLLTLVSFGLGVYFVPFENYTWLSLLFFGVGLLFYILEKVNNYYLLKKYDDYIISPKISMLQDDIEPKLYKIYELKNVILPYPFILFSRLLITLTICVVLIMNDFYNAPNLLIITLLFYMDYHFNKWENNIGLDIDTYIYYMNAARLENKPFHFYVDKINKVSRKSALKRIFFRYIIYFVIFLLTIVMMVISNTYTLNYFIFYFIGYLYFGNVVRELFTIDELKRKRNNAINAYLRLK